MAHDGGAVGSCRRGVLINIHDYGTLLWNVWLAMGVQLVVVEEGVLIDIHDYGTMLWNVWLMMRVLFVVVEKGC